MVFHFLESVLSVTTWKSRSNFIPSFSNLKVFSCSFLHTFRTIRAAIEGFRHLFWRFTRKAITHHNLYWWLLFSWICVGIHCSVVLRKVASPLSGLSIVQILISLPSLLQKSFLNFIPKLFYLPLLELDQSTLVFSNEFRVIEHLAKFGHFFCHLNTFALVFFFFFAFHFQFSFQTLQLDNCFIFIGLELLSHCLYCVVGFPESWSWLLLHDQVFV